MQIVPDTGLWGHGRVAVFARPSPRGYRGMALYIFVSVEQNGEIYKIVICFNIKQYNTPFMIFIYLQERIKRGRIRSVIIIIKNNNNKKKNGAAQSPYHRLV